MSKKQHEKMEEMHPKFIDGAKRRNIDGKTAEKIWIDMEKFASYGFNKAHACVYAHISYQSAYLKAHFPTEYMAAVVTSRMGQSEKFVTARNEAERMGIKILPPNVNASQKICAIQGKNIVVGFNAIKGVGEKAADNIVLSRNEIGRNFENFFDFCANVDLSIVNKTAIESLIFSGAFDCFSISRSQHFDAIEAARAYGKAIREEKTSSQVSMFGDAQDVITAPKFSNMEEWNIDYKLQCERNVLGFYASGSPLDKYKYEIDGISTMKLGLEKGESDEDGFEDGENPFSSGANSSNLMKLHETTQSIAGIITERKVLSSKKDGRSFAFLTLEDIYGIKLEVALWADKYSAYSEFTQKDKIIVVKGRIAVEIGENERDGEDSESEIGVKITADKIIPIEDAKLFLNRVHIELSLDKLKEENLDEIIKICANQKGECSMIIHFVSESGSEFELKSQKAKVNNSPTFLDKLNALPSINSVWLSQ